MRYHLPASHPSAGAASATIAGVSFAYGEAEISDLQVGSLGRALESYGAVRGERPADPPCADPVPAPSPGEGGAASPSRAEAHALAQRAAPEHRRSLFARLMGRGGR